jgi:hypothetical protein
MESNNDAKERNYNGLRAIMVSVATMPNLVMCNPRRGCSFSRILVMTHPSGLLRIAFVPNLVGVKHPGEFRFCSGYVK